MKSAGMKKRLHPHSAQRKPGRVGSGGCALLPIPIAAAKRIAEQYGYDQVVIIARKVGEGSAKGEHVTTYGVTKEHCRIAARIGDYLKHEIMGWPRQ